MKNLFLATALCISTSIFAQIGEKNFIDQNYIEVTGKAEKEIVPDEIYIKIIINETDIKGKKLSEIESAMISKLQEIGVDTKKDLTIKDFVSNFKNYWILKSDIILTKEYQLLAHEAKIAGRVFTELQKLGISNVSIERLDNSKLAEYKKEVKIIAIKAAQEKAKSLSMAINQDIGKAIYIQEMENNFYNYQAQAMGMQVRKFSNVSMEDSMQEEQAIEFEKLKLEYSILVRFELK